MDTQYAVKSDINFLCSLFKNNGVNTYPLWHRKKQLCSVSNGYHVLYTRPEMSTSSQVNLPQTLLTKKVVLLEIWDYSPTILSFSVCFKFKSLSPAFCSVLQPAIFSMKRFATIMCHQWQELLTLWAEFSAAVSTIHTVGVKSVWYTSVEDNHFLIDVLTEIWFFWAWGCFC